MHFNAPDNPRACAPVPFYSSIINDFILVQRGLALCGGAVRTTLGLMNSANNNNNHDEQLNYAALARKRPELCDLVIKFKLKVVSPGRPAR